MDSGNYLERDSILEIDANLRQAELKTLKFLSKNIVSETNLEKIKHSYELIEVLLNRAVHDLSEGRFIIAQFLYLLGRNDLILKLGIDYNNVKGAIEKNCFLSQFRIMLFELSKNMLRDDISRLKFLLLDGTISKSRLSEIKDGEDLLNIMESLYPHEDELKEKLEMCFNIMKCQDLIEILRSKPKSYITKSYESSENMFSNETSRSSRGICLIINNENFSLNTNLRKRPGTDKDADTIQDLFASLKFEVSLHKDKSSEDITKILDQCGKDDHKNHDCFFVFILSHGEAWSVFGTDGNKLSLKSICNSFTEKNCPSLKNKPKVFCIQACQGQDFLHSDLCTDGNSDEDKTITEADFLLSLSTLPGYLSMRSPKTGSWYIQTLTDVIRRDHEKFDFQKLLTISTREINERRGRVNDIEARQVSMTMTTLTQELYL